MKRLLATAALMSALLLTCVGVASAQTPSPYLGEVRLFGFNFCPQNWLPANGQLLLINGNQALFSLFGTAYGGDGRTNFAIPTMSGTSVALHWCVAVAGVFPSRN